MPPPVPPRVNAGRMMSGNVPISPMIRSRSARERATPERGTSSPMRNIASLNNWRSSPFAMACALAPINFTPWRASAPLRFNSMAALSAVCPPRVGKIASGFSRSTIASITDLRRYMTSAIEVTPDRPVLIDRFLEDAVEVDVDCISDGETTVIGAIMEHIEEAGIHSGDSACVIPTFSLSQRVLDEISSATKAMARELNVRGLMNVQFAVKGEDVYVLEVNPRASRTVPFVSKAIGVPLAKLAAKVMVGKKLRQLGFTREIVPKHFSVKEAVFPFLRYQGIDISLGPEMKSTGEVMGIDVDLGLAYAKSQMAAPPPLPKSGNVFVSVKDSDKTAVVPLAREFVELGFGIIATTGTWEALHE